MDNSNPPTPAFGNNGAATNSRNSEGRLTNAFSQDIHFLDTATVGIPPQEEVTRFQNILERWRQGSLEIETFDQSVKQAASSFSKIVGGTPDRCGIIPQLSIASAMVAQSIEKGAKVLLAEEDFTSVLFPFLQRHQHGEIEAVVVPFEQIVDAISSDISWVAVSAVQSSDGRVLDLDALHAKVQETGTRTYLDLTQAAGWLPIGAFRFDVVAASAYKWLLCSRGVGFIHVSASAFEWLRPIFSGWYAGQDPWTSIYGPPLRLADDGRRFNVSPDWFGYYSAGPALDLLLSVGIQNIYEHNVHLTNLLRSDLGLPSSNTAFLSLATDVTPNELNELGIKASLRAGRLRATFHLYNDASDVEAAAKALSGRLV